MEMYLLLRKILLLTLIVQIGSEGDEKSCITCQKVTAITVQREHQCQRLPEIDVFYEIVGRKPLLNMCLRPQLVMRVTKTIVNQPFEAPFEPITNSFTKTIRSVQSYLRDLFGLNDQEEICVECSKTYIYKELRFSKNNRKTLHNLYRPNFFCLNPYAKNTIGRKSGKRKPFKVNNTKINTAKQLKNPLSIRTKLKITKNNANYNMWLLNSFKLSCAVPRHTLTFNILKRNTSFENYRRQLLFAFQLKYAKRQMVPSKNDALDRVPFEDFYKNLLFAFKLTCKNDKVQHRAIDEKWYSLLKLYRSSGKQQAIRLQPDNLGLKNFTQIIKLKSNNTHFIKHKNHTPTTKLIQRDSYRDWFYKFSILLHKSSVLQPVSKIKHKNLLSQPNSDKSEDIPFTEESPEKPPKNKSMLGETPIANSPVLDRSVEISNLGSTFELNKDMRNSALPFMLQPPCCPARRTDILQARNRSKSVDYPTFHKRRLVPGVVNDRCWTLYLIGFMIVVSLFKHIFSVDKRPTTRPVTHLPSTVKPKLLSTPAAVLAARKKFELELVIAIVEISAKVT